MTLCTDRKKCILGEIANGTVKLSSIGAIVQEEWLRTPDVRPRVRLDAFVVMPNHLHGIILLEDPWATHRVAPTKMGLKSVSIGSIIGQFKSAVTKRAGFQPIWQRSFYDRILRTDREFNLTRLYIAANPALWNIDPNNPHSKGELKSIDADTMHQCGFTSEDLELIENYLEYRIQRR